MAFQDGFAKPLAEKLVGKFRVTSVMYVRRVIGAYDPATGVVPATETNYPEAGAITEMGRTEGGGANETREIFVWMSLTDIDEIWPTTSDWFVYEDETWKIVEITPGYGGDKKYACKCRARAA